MQIICVFFCFLKGYQQYVRSLVTKSYQVVVNLANNTEVQHSYGRSAKSTRQEGLLRLVYATSAYCDYKMKQYCVYGGDSL